MEFLDGNALAGTIAEVLGVDPTTVILICDGCGTAGRFAEAHAYGPAPGTVLRCPHCADALIRMVRTESELWLDLRGSRSIRIAVAPA